MSSTSHDPRRSLSRRLADIVRVVVTGAVMLTILALSLGPLKGVSLPSSRSSTTHRRAATGPPPTTPERTENTATPPSTTPPTPPPTGTIGPTTAAAKPGLRLRQQTLWIPPQGGTWQATMALQGLDRSPDYELAVTVHQRVTSKSELSRTFTGEQPQGQSRGGLFVTPLPQVPVTADGDLAVTVPTRGPNAPYIPGTVLLYRPGIYPVSVEVRTVDEGRTVSRVTTHLLAVEQVPEAARLGVAAVVPLDSTPVSHNAAGTGIPEGTETLRALGNAVAALPERTVTLAPSGETLEALAGSPGSPLLEWRAAASRTAVLAGPYVSSDPAALGNRAADELRHQFDVGAATTDGALGVTVDRTLAWMDRPVSPETLTRLAGTGTRRLLLYDDHLNPPPTDTTGNRRPFALALPDHEPVNAVAVDRVQSDRLERPKVDPVLAAYQLLTDLAAEVVLADDDSSKRENQAAVVAPSRHTLLAPEVVTVLGNGLRDAPVLRAMTVEQVFNLPAAQVGDRGRAGGPLRREPKAPPPAPAPLEAPLTRARTALAIANQVLEAPAAQTWPRAILVAQSDRLPAQTAITRLDGITADLQRELGQVQLQRIANLSLTATEGVIPINLVNESGRTAHVRIQLSSQKLDFPEGAARNLDLDRRSTTVLIPVRAKTSGNLPLTVVLTTADGTTELASSDDYRVRATGLPGIGYVLIGGALAVLGWWWARVLRKATLGRRGAGAAPSDAVEEPQADVIGESAGIGEDADKQRETGDRENTGDRQDPGDQRDPGDGRQDPGDGEIRQEPETPVAGSAPAHLARTGAHTRPSKARRVAGAEGEGKRLGRQHRAARRPGGRA